MLASFPSQKIPFADANILGAFFDVRDPFFGIFVSTVLPSIVTVQPGFPWAKAIPTSSTSFRRLETCTILMLILSGTKCQNKWLRSICDWDNAVLG